MLKTDDLYVYAFVDGKNKIAKIIKEHGNMFDIILVASRKFLTIHRSELSAIDDKPTRRSLGLDRKYAIVDNGVGKPITVVPVNQV